MLYRTYSQKKEEISKEWTLIDAEGLIVGRLAAIISCLLRGKHKPTYTPHMDGGDNVVVINAEKIVFTKNKMRHKRYYWHTGYPGGIKSITPSEMMERHSISSIEIKSKKGNRFPAVRKKRMQSPLINAVRNMCGGENPRKDRLISHLYVYNGPNHNHVAQQPCALDIKCMNSKNFVRGI